MTHVSMSPDTERLKNKGRKKVKQFTPINSTTAQQTALTHTHTHTYINSKFGPLSIYKCH